MTSPRGAAAVLIGALAVVPFAIWWSDASAGKIDPATIVMATATDARRPFIPFSELASPAWHVNGQRVLVEGFMLPLDATVGGVTHFLLTARFDQCLFGLIAPINEQIDVTMTGGRRTLFTHQRLRAFGMLHVTSVREDGRLLGVYRLDGEWISVVE